MKVYKSEPTENIQYTLYENGSSYISYKKRGITMYTNFIGESPEIDSRCVEGSLPHTYCIIVQEMYAEI